MTVWPKAANWIIGAEGGYVANPRDPGGSTNYGISQRAYPDVDVKTLTPAQAADIYRRDYWTRIRGEELPPVLALAVFDAAVNQGVHTAVTLLQRVLGVRDDGSIGPETVNAARACDVRRTLAEYLLSRAFRYASTGGADVFLRGWVNRLRHLRDACALLEVSR